MYVEHVESVLTNGVTQVSFVVKVLVAQEIGYLHEVSIVELPDVCVVRVEGRLSVDHKCSVAISYIFTLGFHEILGAR